MRVEGVIPAAEVDDHVVAGDGVERDRHCGRRARHVLGDAGLDGADDSVADRQRLGAIGQVALVLFFIAAEGLALGVSAHPVDGKALRDGGASTDRNQRAPMAGAVRRTVGREPIVAVQRRADPDRTHVAHRHSRRANDPFLRIVDQANAQTMLERRRRLCRPSPRYTAPRADRRRCAADRGRLTSGDARPQTGARQGWRASSRVSAFPSPRMSRPVSETSRRLRLVTCSS